MKKTSTATPWAALIHALVPATSLTAQVLVHECGNEGGSPCAFFSAEHWPNDRGTCDRGLTNSIDDLSFFFGNAGLIRIDPVFYFAELPNLYSEYDKGIVIKLDCRRFPGPVAGRLNQHPNAPACYLFCQNKISLRRGSGN